MLRILNIICGATAGACFMQTILRALDQHFAAAIIFLVVAVIAIWISTLILIWKMTE